MKKVLSGIAVLLMSVFMVAAADREQFSVTELSVGKVISLEGATAGATIGGKPDAAFSFLDDFLYFLASTNEAGQTLAPWRHTGDTLAATNNCIVGTGAGGILTFTTGSTSNNEAYIQHGVQATEAPFNISSGGLKKVYFETRVAAGATGVPAGFFVGLAGKGSSTANFLVDSTGGMMNTNIIGFQCVWANTNAFWNFVTRKCNSAVLTNACIVTNAGPSTYVRLGFSFDGENKIRYFVNGVEKGTNYILNAGNFNDGVGMSPIIAAKTLTDSYTPTNKVDYIYVNQER